MEPVQAAFAVRWSEAEIVNLLDDSLTIDRARMEDLSDAMIERFLDLGRYSLRNGADGILATCSAFGPALDAMAADLPIPVLKPNEAMFRTALELGHRIGMLATFAPAVASMTLEFDQMAAAMSVEAELETFLVQDAGAHLRAGDATSHNRLVADSARHTVGYDVLMLAHFSTARAEAMVRQATDLPVLTAPGTAVDRMREMISGLAPIDDLET
jgi:hypothetical protein